MENTEVTRPKHPGRVAQGKRLVEWNRKNKGNLRKNEVLAQVSSSGGQVLAQVPSSSCSAGLGIILLICVAGGGIYFYSWKTPAQRVEPQGDAQRAQCAEPQGDAPKKKEVKRWME